MEIGREVERRKDNIFVSGLRKVVLHPKRLQIENCYLSITRKPCVVHVLSKVKGEIMY